VGLTESVDQRVGSAGEQRPHFDLAANEDLRSGPRSASPAHCSRRAGRRRCTGRDDLAISFLMPHSPDRGKGRLISRVGLFRLVRATTRAMPTIINSARMTLGNGGRAFPAAPAGIAEQASSRIRKQRSAHLFEAACRIEELARRGDGPPCARAVPKRSASRVSALE